MNKSISVFFPAYNEEDNIREAVLSVDKYLKKNFSKYEIIVVDDGSRDKTPEIVSEIAKGNKNVKLARHKTNLGYGAAIRTGFKTAKNDLIFYTDSDNQFKITDLKKVLPMIEDYDIVSGFRIKRQDPLARIITSNVYNLIINILFNPKVRDIDSSFKLYKKSVIDSLSLKSKTGLIEG